MKPCTKCGQVKPVEEFHRFANARDGRRAECKTCALARAKDRYNYEPIRPMGAVSGTCRHLVRRP